MVETITMNPSNLNEIMTLQTRSGISEAVIPAFLWFLLKQKFSLVSKFMKN